jgi:hypothetical protein
MKNYPIAGLILIVLLACSACVGNTAEEEQPSEPLGESRGFVSYEMDGAPPLYDPGYLKAHGISRIRKVRFYENLESLPEFEQRKVEVEGKEAVLVEVREIDREGNDESVTRWGSEGAILNRTSREYDAEGRILVEESGSPAIQRLRSRYHYNDAGDPDWVIRLLYELKESGAEDTLMLDTMFVDYNEHGRELGRYVVFAGDTVEQVTVISDEFRRVISRERWSKQHEYEFRNRVSYTYNNNGKIESVTEEQKIEPDGEWERMDKTLYEYNALGWIHSYVEGGEMKKPTYNENGLFFGLKSEEENYRYLYDYHPKD